MPSVFSRLLTFKVLLSTAVLVALASGATKLASSADAPSTREDYEHNPALMV